MNLNYISYAEAQREGYIPYAGPYKPNSERWMIERAVADILANGRDRYAIVKKGSQEDIYILPNYYLTTSFTGQPYRRIHGDESEESATGFPTVATPEEFKSTYFPESAKVSDAEVLSENIWSKTLEEIAGAEPRESEVAQEVFESEGGSTGRPDNR